MRLTDHFDSDEFKCKCGCGCGNPDKKLLTMLEMLRTKLGDKPIIITSGYRCPKHSVDVGGYATDAHTCNIAADIAVKGVSVEDVAAAAELVGFTGIGLMTGAVHVDIRDGKNYSNAHWYGDERTGENVKTFIRTTSNKKETMTVKAFGKTYKVTVEQIGD